MSDVEAYDDISILDDNSSSFLDDAQTRQDISGLGSLML
jgi:hypothetical protein